MKKERKSIIIMGLIITLVSFQMMGIQLVETDAIDPFFTLVFKTNGGGIRPDYGNLLRQYIARIGIDVEVIIQDWPTFVGELIAFRDFDICYVGFQGSGTDPDFSGLYDENGSLNLFGYHTSMDYDETLGTGINEWFIQEGKQIMPPDSVERINHYWDWEQYMMDKICPLLPMFTPRDYQAHWSNLHGYNFTYGLKQSWGHMSWDGTHPGQQSTNEIVISDAVWSDLNPIYHDDASSSFVSKLILDPLITVDFDNTVWPHLAVSVDYIDDTTIEIVCREGIKWQTDPNGLFTNEFFDVEDVYFTLYTWKYATGDYYRWGWIESMDIIDDMTLRINVDADPDTPGQQAYAPSLNGLNIDILPEHYLNQTQLEDGVFPEISHPSWSTFATNAFGTSLFEIQNFEEGEETILTVFDDCWWLNTPITSDSNLNWVERYGDFSGGLDTLRIKIIPDNNFALYALENGYIDIESVTSFRDTRKEMEANPDFTVQSKLAKSFGFFGFNMRESRDYIGDREPSIYRPDLTVGLCVRKAICYAINLEEMNEVIHSSEYEINYWPIYPSMGIWCNPNIIKYEYDLEKARMYIDLASFDADYFPGTPGFSFWIGFTTLLIIACILPFTKELKEINYF